LIRTFDKSDTSANPLFQAADERTDHRLPRAMITFLNSGNCVLVCPSQTSVHNVPNIERVNNPTHQRDVPEILRGTANELGARRRSGARRTYRRLNGYPCGRACRIDPLPTSYRSRREEP
jgi:hypothetical protein